MQGENNTKGQSRRVFSEYLTRMNLRHTAERMKLLDLVCSFTGAFSAEQLYDVASASEMRVAPATVYNTLRIMCDSGILRVGVGEGRERVYEIGAVSGIFTVCRRCGRTKALHDSTAETFMAFHRFRGIAMECFTLTVTGLCPSCARAVRKKKASGEARKETIKPNKENQVKK